MHYHHPRIGFAFDLPDEWELHSAHMSAEGVMVVLHLGDTRLLLQIRPSQGNAAARLNFMREHLESVRATHIAPCQAPPFGQSRDIVALSFFIAGHQQRWISVGQDGYDYTISHTDEWQDVGGAVDRLSASFVFPSPAHIGHGLPRSGVHNDNDSRDESGARPNRWAPPHRDMEWADAAAPPPLDAPDQVYGNNTAHHIPALAAALWQRFSERLRRVARPQE